jgi:ABC-type Mn2+/Zn2+ transport system permease subunit
MMPNILSLILGLAAASVCGVVGSFALMKRMTLAGDVVAHLALPGLGLAFMWGINPLAGAAVTLLAGIVIVHHLQRKSALATETALGVVFVGALAVGALVTPREDLMDALFGGYSEVTVRGFVAGMLACAIVLGTIAIMRHRLILVIFSSDLAASLGINVDRINLMYLGAFGVAILLSLRFLGALLVGAMIIVPAATGRRLAGTLSGFLLCSSMASVLSVAAGFAIASQWHFALGPTIVATSCVLFLATFIVRR